MYVTATLLPLHQRDYENMNKYITIRIIDHKVNHQDTEQEKFKYNLEELRESNEWLLVLYCQHTSRKRKIFYKPV